MTQQDLERVPGRDHYSLKYLKGGRIFSYAHQIDTVISFDPETVLEVGAGGGVVTAALRAAGVTVSTLDIQPELVPDITGSVTQIPCDDGAFDLALCSQVLEHLPFEQFVPALRELRRVAKQGLVLSLPDASPYYQVRLRLPKIRNYQWTGTRHCDPGSTWKAWKLNDDGHYWEIGYDETPFSSVRDGIVAAGYSISAHWRVPEMYCHHFFKLSTN